MVEAWPKQLDNLPEFTSNDARLLDAASDPMLTAAVEAQVRTKLGVDLFFRERLTGFLAHKYKVSVDEVAELFDMRIETRIEEIRVKGHSRG